MVVGTIGSAARSRAQTRPKPQRRQDIAPAASWLGIM
jgi:hypothetical protein